MQKEKEIARSLCLYILQCDAHFFEFYLQPTVVLKLVALSQEKGAAEWFWVVA
jgi:hypothetical protein